MEVDKDHDAMIIFLAEPEVVVTDDVGAKVFLALDMSRFEGNIGTLQKKHRQMPLSVIWMALLMHLKI